MNFVDIYWVGWSGVVHSSNFCTSQFLAESFAYLRLQVLKESLVRQGFTFESETDTEVIPKLAKFVFDKANEGEGRGSAYAILNLYWFSLNLYDSYTQ